MAAADLVDELVRSDLVDDPRRGATNEPRAAIATARRRVRWGKEAALGAVAAGALAGFLVLSRAVRANGGPSFDRAVVRRFGRVRGSLTDTLARGLTFFGAVPGVGLLSLGALLLARRTPRLALQVGVGAIGGVAAELGIKRLFRRPRPTLLAHLEDVHSTSFPSGHAMAAASFYLTLAFVGSRSARLRGHRAPLLASAGAVAATIGATRVYLGVHWPTDVLAGLALGTTWACLSEAAFDLDAVRSLDAGAAVTG